MQSLTTADASITSEAPVGTEAATLRTNGQYGAAADGSVLDLDQFLDALQTMRSGDFSVRLPGNLSGAAGKVADTFNEIVAANQRMAEQLELVGQVVGREGKTRTRVKFGLTHGAWAEMETSVNSLINDLLWPMTAVTGTITAVAKGDLLQTAPLDVSHFRANSCVRPISSTR